MGWNINLKSTKEITEEEIQNIVDSLPLNYRNNWITSKQAWGWVTAVDINNPQGNDIGISGSYTESGKIAKNFSKYLKEELEKNKHEISIEYCW